MPVGKQNKLELIDALERSVSKAHRLVVTLRFQDREPEARRVEARAKKLSKRIDKLVAVAMDDWLGNARLLKQRLARSNAKLQASLRRVQRKKDVATNVVKIVSYLDDLIQLADDLLPP
jgi:ribosomal protein L17